MQFPRRDRRRGNDMCFLCRKIVNSHHTGQDAFNLDVMVLCCDMHFMIIFLVLCVLGLLSSSCGLGKRDSLMPDFKDQDRPFGSTGIPPDLRPATAASDGTRVEPGGNRSGQPVNFEITPDDQMIFTNPDDPDSIIPELANLLAEQGQDKGSWERSESVARKRSMRENKALLIWFTDTGRSPNCRMLEEELFAAMEFNQWADEKLIRLKIDSNLTSNPVDEALSFDESETLKVKIRNYVAEMRRRYRVAGSPTLVVLDASGEVLARYRGFKRGGGEVLFGKIRHSEFVATRNQERWRSDMEQRGYRDWQDMRGRVSIFARLVGYRDGELILIEPDGGQVRTREAHLSAKDRAWIQQQKLTRDR